jgi:hypothetical protein
MFWLSLTPHQTGQFWPFTHLLPKILAGVAKKAWEAEFFDPPSPQGLRRAGRGLPGYHGSESKRQKQKTDLVPTKHANETKKIHTSEIFTPFRVFSGS